MMTPNIKVYKVYNTDNGLFKRSARSYSYQDYWSKVGMVYSTKGGAVGAAKSAKKKYPNDKITVVSFYLTPIDEEIIN